MLALLAFTLVAQTAAAPTAAPPRLKVLVLDVQSADLTANERTTLTNLAAAQLSEDTRLEVLSGEDIKQLVKLQGQAQDIGVEGNCTDACMAELAGALGAGVVVATQAGKLGETLVLSLVVFDAAKAKTVSRKSVQATSLGELPSKLGPALDALVQPLLPSPPVVVAPTGSAPTEVRTSTATTTPREMSPRLRELYDVEAMQVCFDPENRASWWFCNQKQSFTENVFVREYRALTGSDDLDRADVNRGVNVLVPIGLFTLGAAGVAGMGAVLGCGLAEVCGEDLHDTFNMDDGVVGPLTLGFSMAALVGGLTGGIISTSEDPDGIKEMHVLSEGEGRGAIARYNTALREKLARDLGE
jgi:hypothetical protein